MAEEFDINNPACNEIVVDVGGSKPPVVVEVGSPKPPVTVNAPTLGEPGPKGDRGEPGSDWRTGAGVPSIIAGDEEDDLYLNETNGDVYQVSSDAWVLRTNIKGPIGNDGPQGFSALSGIVNPLPGVGVDGDTYINTDSGATFKKIGGLWFTDGGDLTGPTGEDAVTDNTPYGPSWDGSLVATTRDAIYDKVESLAATDIGISRIGSPAHADIQAAIDTLFGVGLVSGGIMSNNGDGTVAITAGAGFIRATDSDLAETLSFEFAAVASQILTDNDVTYIYVEYNAGSPQIAVALALPTDLNTNLLIGAVQRAGTFLHPTPYRYIESNLARELSLRLYNVDGTAHASGAAISETGTLNIAITEGDFYLGLNRGTFAAEDTSVASTFIDFYRDGGGGWVVSGGNTAIDALQYDDGSGTLATLGNNQYGVHWVYISPWDQDIYVIYGHGNYTAPQAADATPPATLPDQIDGWHGILAGKIIVQKSASVFTAIESAFVKLFISGDTKDHGDLAGLGDDDHAQYHNDARGDLLYGPSVVQTLTNKSIDATTNTLTNVGLDEVNQTLLDLFSMANGLALDSPAITVDSDGATILLSLEKSGTGDIRFVFSDGIHMHDCTPADTVALVEGTDAIPVLNCIYVDKTTKLLTSATVGFPSTEHAPIALVLCQSAASLQADKAMMVHAWTDHASGPNGQGHLAHVNYKLRKDDAEHISGCELTPAAGVGTMDVSTVSGVVLQLHDHVFPAFNTATGSDVYVVNDPTTANKKIGDLTLTSIPVDANGDALGTTNTDYYNLVIWGAVSEGEVDCKLFCNLPNGAYKDNVGDKAVRDENETAVYTIPDTYTNVGFLIACVTVHWVGGTYSVEGNTSLLGTVPGNSAGGGTPGAGLPAGGSTGEILDKVSAADYDTQWVPKPLTADTTNVTAAGALMDSELADIAAVKATTGTFLVADQAKLDGIATAATANSSDAILLSRANHTGAQSYTTITGLTTDVVPAGLVNKYATTSSVTDAGALMDSEVAADLKTLALPANTTITTFAATVLDDTTAAAARTTLGVAVGSDVQAWDAVLDATTASFLTADETHLDAIEAGAEVNNVKMQATAPATSELWFHTTDLVMYAYDSVRTGWFALEEQSIVFNYSLLETGLLTTTVLKIGEAAAYGITKSGWPCPFDLTVTGYEWRNRYDNVGHRIRIAIIYADDTYDNSYYSVFPAGTANIYGEHDLDLDYDVQDAIGAITATGSGSSQTQYQTLTVTYRRRPS